MQYKTTGKYTFYPKTNQDYSSNMIKTEFMLSIYAAKYVKKR